MTTAACFELTPKVFHLLLGKGFEMCVLSV